MDNSSLYWEIRLGDVRQGAWKLDLWFPDSPGWESHAEYSNRMRKELTSNKREIILAIKEAYWRRPEYRDTVTSDLIYRAVLLDGIRSIGEFEEFIRAGSSE